jgi:hypothetical protein
MPVVRKYGGLLPERSLGYMQSLLRSPPLLVSAAHSPVDFKIHLHDDTEKTHGNKGKIGIGIAATGTHTSYPPRNLQHYYH